MKKILITGGCGFIGVNLIDFLRRESSLDIVVLDNLVVGRVERIHPFEVEFIEGDIRDMDIIRRAVKGVDGIVHLAADTRVMDSIANPVYNFHVNVNGTFNILTAAHEAKVPRLVFASTGGAIIGEVEPPVHELMVPRPMSPYGASKLSSEGYLSAFRASYGIIASSLRFSNVYGPRSFHKGSIVAHLMKCVISGSPITIYGDGSQTRDYVYVDDISRGIFLALMNNLEGGVYQLGSGEPTSLNELISALTATIGDRQMPEINYKAFRAGEIVHTYSRIDKARLELGFSPKNTLREGLRETWNWFVNNSLHLS